MSEEAALIAAPQASDMVETKGSVSRLLAGLGSRLASRPAFTLLIFNLAAQAITLAAAPLLTRLYSPGELGVLGAVTAIVSMGVPLATGRLELAIPGATPRESFALMLLCGASVSCAVLVLGVLSFLGAHHFDGAFFVALRAHWYLAPLALLFMALYDMLGMEASRRHHLMPLATSKLTQASAGVASQVALGLWGLGVTGLLLGFVLNQAAGVARLFRIFFLGHPARGPVDFATLKACLVRYRRYPLFSSWTGFLESGSKWCVQIAFAALWDPTVAGFIFLTERVVGRPLQLISSSLLPVYVAQVSRGLATDPAGLYPTFRSTLLKQCAVVLAWVVVVIALAPHVFAPLFGHQWDAAVPYVQVMSLAMAPMACLHAVAHTLQIAGRQRLESALVVAKVLSIVAVLAAGYLLQRPALETLKWYAATLMAFGLLTAFFHRRTILALARAAKTKQET
jgi:O-antigen/teichoic acid export membrane protein